MNYKKEKKENYNLHLISTDRFKEISVSLRFTKAYNKEEAAYLKLLERVLVTNGTKKYKTLKEISKELENLYRTNISSRFFATSKNMTFEFKITMINPKYTSMDIYIEAFALLKEILTNPQVENNAFKENVFKLEKENLIKSILNVKDDPEAYGRIKFESSFYKGTIYEENNYKNIKNFKELENKKLFEIYKSLLNDFKIDVLVLGDFDEEIVKKEIQKLLKNHEQNDSTHKNLYIKIKEQGKIENKEKIETSLSNLFVGCTINGLTEEERDYKLILYNTILGSMNNSVLFVNVREKHSLCYHIGSIISKYTSTIVIDSGINKKNYEKTLKLIEESIKSMEDIKVVSHLMTNAKKTLEIAYNDFYDNMAKIIDYYFLNEFTHIPSIEERRQHVLKIEPEEICELAKKVEIKNIFLLEGSINEEN